MTYLYLITNVHTGNTYVGMSNKPHARFRAHLTGRGCGLIYLEASAQGRDTFSLKLLAIGTRSYIQSCERQYIARFKPRYNKTHQPKRRRSPTTRANNPNPLIKSIHSHIDSPCTTITGEHNVAIVRRLQYLIDNPTA